MTIRTKVQLGFALILALFVATCGLSVDRMTSMFRHSSELTDRVIPTLNLTAEMSVVLGRIRVAEAQHILEQDPLRMDIIGQEIEKLQARMTELLKQYQPLITSHDQRYAYDSLVKDFDAYDKISEELLPVSKQNLTQQAFDVLRSSAPIHANLMARLAQLDELTRRLAVQASNAEREVFDNTKNGAIIAVVLLAGVLIAFAILFNRTIFSPVRRLIGVIERLADGDLANDIPMARRHDELGDVARALVHFRDNAVEKDRLQKQEREDLEFARRIQLASVPNRFPAFPERNEIEICGRLLPTRAVGGDFFDFYFIDDRRLVIVIGDASGKGVASAMFVGMARSALKSESVRNAEPSQTLGGTNRAIAADNEAMMFMTTFYGVLDVVTGELSFANAGHTPVYLMKKSGGVEPVAAVPGLPLGVVEEFNFAPDGFRLDPGDAIVLYTDGVTEAADLKGALFGEQRLEGMLGRHQGESCDAIVETLFGAVRDFSHGAPQSDDIAVLVLRYNGPSNVAGGNAVGGANAVAAAR